MGHDILIVDDERDICTLIAGILEDEGHTARRAHNSSEAIEAVRQRRPALVILDVWLQGSELDGLQLLEFIRRDELPTPVVMISGHGTIDTAVSAIKSGAYDFIEKPFKADRLLLVVDRAIETDRLRRENATLRRRAGGEVTFVGSSATAANVRGQIERVAPTGSRVLITGPSGVGKETAARLIHQGSKRSEGPFVVVNCSTLPAERLEIELFGTDGETDHDTLHVSGAFELAHGGTLLLKEVSDLPVGLQSRLARVLQEQSYMRDAGKTRVEVDVRVLASTTNALQDSIAAGQFREELFHRLNVVSLRVPALSERREDIPELAADLLRRVADATGLSERTLGEDTSAALQGHDWPGNVRQLRNVIESAVLLADAETLLPCHLPPEVTMGEVIVESAEASAALVTLSELERRHIQRVLAVSRGQMSVAAEILGIHRNTLRRKLAEYGLGSQLVHS
jgi:two-component system nitrogen regulation response regulator NtrX